MKLLSPREVGEILGFTPKTVYELTKKGYIKTIKVGSRYRYSLNQGFFRNKGLTYKSVYGEGEND
jgi:excisionase family DNA binding protein